MKSTSAEDLAGIDLVLTSYAALLRLDWLGQPRWGLAVVDEAQAIKNPEAKQTRAVKSLDAESRVALTGTPIENDLRDLWSIFDFLNPGLLGSKMFAGFVKSLAERTPPNYAPLRKLVGPYILRRLKTDRDVIADLPDKTEVKAFCALSRRQAALYQSTVSALEEHLGESSDDMGRRGLVMATLVRLKQICNHAQHGLGGGGRWESADSGKFARLSEIAATVASRQEKMLVFTQSAQAIEPLGDLFAGVFGRRGLALSGETAVGKRRTLVKTFQEDEGVPFFVLSLKAGGSGPNFPAAGRTSRISIVGGTPRSRTRGPIAPSASARSTTCWCTSSSVVARSRSESTNSSNRIGACPMTCSPAAAKSTSASLPTPS
jgi:SNF2 family DNA or RNA helicase